jgi:hypothetical protein
MGAVAASAALGLLPRTARALTLAPVDGGPRYYAKFSSGLPAKPSYFPLGVWFESVIDQEDVDEDMAAGLNTYLVLTADSDLGLIRSNGMHAIVGSDLGSHEVIKGWFLADEVDMTHGPGSGYAEMERVANATPDDGRFRYSGYGKGVLFWQTDAEAARFVNGFQDVVQADAYFFTDNDVCDSSQAGGEPGINETNHCHVASNYGWIIDRLQSLVSPAGTKPVWAVVELGHPFTESDWPTIAPAQVRAAVWQSVIAGARGIIYFNHSFGGPNESQHILRDGARPGSAYAPIRAAVTATNRRITELAPVLNSPTVTSGWSQGRGTTAMLKWANGGKAAGCKSKSGKKPRSCRNRTAAESKQGGKKGAPKGDLYLFAGSAGSPVNGRFSLPCVGNAKARVVGENRGVRIHKGSFRDRFAGGNAIHIYRIDAGSKCGVSRRAAVSNDGLPAGGNPGGSSDDGSNGAPWIVITAIGVGLAGLLAFVGIRRLSGPGPHRSGRRPKPGHRLRTR